MSIVIASHETMLAKCKKNTLFTETGRKIYRLCLKMQFFIPFQQIFLFLNLSNAKKLHLETDCEICRVCLKMEFSLHLNSFIMSVVIASHKTMLTKCTKTINFTETGGNIYRVCLKMQFSFHLNRVFLFFNLSNAKKLQRRNTVFKLMSVSSVLSSPSHKRSWIYRK